MPRKRNGTKAKAAIDKPATRTKEHKTSDPEDTLGGVFLDTLANNEIIEYCDHIGLKLTLENLGDFEALCDDFESHPLWLDFKAHYTEAGKINQHRVAADLAAYPKIAQRIVYLMGEKDPQKVLKLATHPSVATAIMRRIAEQDAADRLN